MKYDVFAQTPLQNVNPFSGVSGWSWDPVIGSDYLSKGIAGISSFKFSFCGVLEKGFWDLNPSNVSCKTTGHISSGVLVMIAGFSSCIMGLTSDDVTKLSNAWQRRKLVLNKGIIPYKSMLGEKSRTWRSSLFLRGEVRTVLTTSSQLSASHFKRYC